VVERPRKDAPFELEVDGVQIRRGLTDRKGMIEVDIPPGAKTGKLVLDPGTALESELRLLLGQLNPMTKISGVKQRLRNLGYDCGEVGEEPTPELEWAVADFQAEHGLEITGELDDQTRDELQKANGA